MRPSAVLLLAGLLLVVLALVPEPASAHALQGKLDLPIPEWLFVWGASLVLIVSFVALSLAWNEPRWEEDDWRPLPGGLSRASINPVTEALAGLVGVALLGVVIWTGLEGIAAPDQNFAPTFVYVTFWLGMVLLSVLFGDVFRAFNPWRAMGRAAGWTVARVSGGRSPSPLPYPEGIGRWPAVAGLLGFLLLELIFGGEDPGKLATATIVYTVFNLVAMAAYGTESWTRRGEAFSAYFGMLSQLSPLEVRDGRLGRRRPLGGAARFFAVPGSIALVLVAIGGTAYDGASEGPLVDPISTVFGWLFDAGVGQISATRVTGTLFLLASVVVVGAVFWLGVRGMQTVAGSPRLRELGRLFAHSLVPIALAYVVAHYFTLFIYQEQAQFTYLLSDPLGEGSDFFGTASGGIDYSVISANAVWYVQVGALVAGHVAGLVYAHDRALAAYGNVRSATRSQYWMLAVMVAFTCLGLFLLSQANQ